MIKKDIQEFFDVVSPEATVRQRTEKEIIEMLNQRRGTHYTIRRTLCIAALICVLIAGVAFAAVSAFGILDRLFPKGEPSKRALETVVNNAASATQNGVSINMDEYLMDQNTLHFAWTVSSEREKDVFYTTSYKLVYSNQLDEAIEGESTGGAYGAYSSSEVGDGILARLSQENPSFHGNAGFGYKAALNSPVEAKVVIHAYETDYTLTDVKSVFDLSYADEGDSASIALEKAREIGISPDQMTSVNGYKAYNDAVSKLTDAGMDWDAATEAALAQSGIFSEVAVLELSVRVDSAQLHTPRFRLGGACRFDFSDRTVILQSLTLDTASTEITYDVISKTEFNIDNAAGNGISYLLFDQDGKPLNSDYALNMNANQLADTDGRYAYRVTISGYPLPETVTAITFVPTTNTERRIGESSNDYALRIKELTAPEQWFTVKLG